MEDIIYEIEHYEDCPMRGSIYKTGNFCLLLNRVIDSVCECPLLDCPLKDGNRIVIKWIGE